MLKFLYGYLLVLILLIAGISAHLLMNDFIAEQIANVAYFFLLLVLCTEGYSMLCSRE